MIDPAQGRRRLGIYDDLYACTVDAARSAKGEMEPKMTCPRAVEALMKQQDRLTGLLRLIDDGRWWTGDGACLIDQDEVCLQSERISAALDVVERLANEMAAENGTGTGSQLAPKARHDVPVLRASEDLVIPDDLGPFSPGPVDPHPEAIHASGGYERRAWSLSGGTSKLA
ncbi:hypothetical protein IPV08_18285 [Methylobacterium sp. SD274]|uniref:hypothetical protein n=1 Tax=Methylobacterium sp. SD274 TaxID=2782009 RepID=UPI001A96DC67|nr:hypothetical protein [Methylobacterium sp. SD274]MBO1021905.1 hypothetical protein [Methylobacterium sp. SD274]